MDLNITMAEGEEVHAFEVFCNKCKGSIYTLLLNGEGADMFAQSFFRIMIEYLECSTCGEPGRLLMRELEIRGKQP